MALVVILALAMPVAAVSLFLFAFRSSGPSGPPRAVIIDQLELTFPNPDFAERATDLLEQAGYLVDYYPGEEVTVDLYRNLPADDYELVLLRVHAARMLAPDGVTETDDVSLFTGEPFTLTRYLDDLRARRLAQARYLPGMPIYFGITADFVSSSMKGKFGDTTIILMGCDGLRSDAMAEAFMEAGAEAFVSWDGAVSANHTDAATERLLHYLLVEERALSEAVTLAMADVGPDPSYGSELVLYPAEAERSAVR